MRPIRILSVGETLTADKALQREIDDRETTIQNQKKSIKSLSRRVSSLRHAEAQLSRATADAEKWRNLHSNLEAEVARLNRMVCSFPSIAF